MQQNARARPYELLMLALCLYALSVLVVSSFLSLDPNTRVLLNWSDTVVCVFFFADFLVQIARAPNRWRYFVTWGWIDLLSSVPSVEIRHRGLRADAYSWRAST